MRLIDAPIGIFRFDDELVLKTEYWSENKLSGKYIPDCYIIRTGEYFWGGAKTANELNNLDVEPVDFAELLPTVTDIISRQQAIDALRKMQTYKLFSGDDMLLIDQAGAMTELMLLPPAEPQIIHCKDCKHRPVVEEGYDEEEWDSGFCLDFPDNVCPCGCDDHFYNWLPKDDFYCGFAERMEVG